mgnify:CR=1 FL=1
MAERERLIELLEQAKIKALITIGSLNNGWGAWYADHLLKNGVIVPPVKLGQTVYTIQGQRKHPKEWTVVGIWKSEEVCNFHMVCYIGGKFEASASMDEDLIGKSVFLTREEATEALKERDNK